jgi:hypothetical protein
VRRFQQAAAAWDREVDEIAAEMIELGMAPFAAAIEAAKVVRQRRLERSLKRGPFSSPEREPSNG